MLPVLSLDDTDAARKENNGTYASRARSRLAAAVDMRGKPHQEHPGIIGDDINAKNCSALPWLSVHTAGPTEGLQYTDASGVIKISTAGGIPRGTPPSSLSDEAVLRISLSGATSATWIQAQAVALLGLYCESPPGTCSGENLFAFMFKTASSPAPIGSAVIINGVSHPASDAGPLLEKLRKDVWPRITSVDAGEFGNPGRSLAAAAALIRTVTDRHCKEFNTVCLPLQGMTAAGSMPTPLPKAACLHMLCVLGNEPATGGEAALAEWNASAASIRAEVRAADNGAATKKLIAMIVGEDVDAAMLAVGIALQKRQSSEDARM
jgi:hypothetical protein